VKLYDYALNSKIEYPHSNHANNVQFYFSESENKLKIVSIGDDNKFKIWG
jgi:hypothetical protein